GLLSDEKSLVRLAAVTALGSIDSEVAVTGLIRALADPEPSISQNAAACLVNKGRTPLQASLVGPRDPLAAGEVRPVEWRVTNLSPAEVELMIDEPPMQRLKLTGPGGPVPTPAAAGGKRLARLGPGEFVGGAFPDLALKLAVAGRYTVNWSTAVTWNGKQVPLTAAPIFIDRR